MRHRFCAVKQDRYPIPGDLIRSTDSGDFINVVLSVSEEKPVPADEPHMHWHKDHLRVWVRSVRYGKVNHGNFLKLDGRRSKNIQWFRNPQAASPDWAYFSNWQIVEEYVPFDNKALIAHTLYLLKDTITHWVPKTDQTEESEDV